MTRKGMALHQVFTNTIAYPSRLMPPRPARLIAVAGE